MKASEIANRIDEVSGSSSLSGTSTFQDLREARLHHVDRLLSGTSLQASQPLTDLRSRSSVGGLSEAERRWPKSEFWKRRQDGPVRPLMLRRRPFNVECIGLTQTSR
jgi:hypothetical protein